MISSNEKFHFHAIGTIASPYSEKFAIPRQPGLVSAAKGKIQLTNSANNPELVRGLEQFSHIWVLFIFHGTAEQGWKPLVRPPRLGGNKKLGVLATRSTFRPNPVGMSVVKLDKITNDNKQLELHISGLDLLDGTPVIDIKPYIPYSDALTNVNGGFAEHAPEQQLAVTYTLQAQQQLAKHQASYPELTQLITQVLAQDPRPAYKKNELDTKEYGIRLYQLNIKWRLISASAVEVFEVN